MTMDSTVFNRQTAAISPPTRADISPPLTAEPESVASSGYCPLCWVSGLSSAAWWRQFLGNALLPPAFERAVVPQPTALVAARAYNRNSPSGGEDSPYSSSPQHLTVPSVLTPQVWCTPALTEANAPSDGRCLIPRLAECNRYCHVNSRDSRQGVHPSSATMASRNV